MTQTITAIDALYRLSQGERALDVRSEGEFQTGQIPGFKNHPILNNKERHLVGLCYKEQGQEAAVKLGLDIASPSRQSRIQEWKNLSHSQPLMVTCWRGGLRSKFACEWLAQEKIATVRVEDGYKALRNQLLTRLKSLPPFIILGGWTGTGKTKLIQKLKGLDIEGIAKHRGSSLGATLFETQPSQTTFENNLLFQLSNKSKTYLLEDESIKMGQCLIPLEIKKHMQNSPVVFLTAPLEKRIEALFEEYIQEPLNKNFGYEALHRHYVSCLTSTRRRLGGLRHSELMTLVNDAFSAPLDFERHQRWIQFMLKEHYDPTYKYSFEKLNRKVLFEGDEQAVSEFLSETLHAIP